MGGGRTAPLPTALPVRRDFFFFLITLGLELSDTKVYEPLIRARLGTAARFCRVLVLKLR